MAKKQKEVGYTSKRPPVLKVYNKQGTQLEIPYEETLDKTHKYTGALLYPYSKGNIKGLYKMRVLGAARVRWHFATYGDNLYSVDWGVLVWVKHVDCKKPILQFIRHEVLRAADYPKKKKSDDF